MDTIFIAPFIHTLQQCSAEMVSILLFICCALSILVLFKFFGKTGLYLFNIVAVLASNIQVLRSVHFNFTAEPIALGTVVFACTYLCSDILTEHYGKEAAKKGVWYCFAGQILMTVLMILAVGYPSGGITDPNEQAMALLFTPSPRLLIASLIAFALSHFNDIWVFQTLNQFTRGRWLWLRTNIATCVSALLDTVIFSVLAWVILSPEPLTLSTLFVTYILGSFLTRCLISLCATPVMYLSYLARPDDIKPSFGKGNRYVSEF